MKYSAQCAVLLCAAAVFFPAASRAGTLDDIGVTALRAVTTNVDGSGIRVAQAEASLTTDLLTWEVKPANVGQPASRFTYYSAGGSTNVYPNSLGSRSWHAEDVGNAFYGIPNGVATNVAHVDNYEADFYITNYIFTSTTNYVFVLAPMPPAAVVNQSFTFGNETNYLPTPTNYLGVSDQQAIDWAYDEYAAEYGVLFVSAVNNGGSVSPPGTAYNCIGVAAYNGSSSIGPTLDNGRCKPDITAPGGYTSFSTPYVSGAAAVLMSAALRGDGGGDTNAAFDMRTIKALLLNGAVKPAGWTNSTSSPLDARYGAGVLNVFNAYEQLAGGMNGVSVASYFPSGAAHPPGNEPDTVATLSGWNFKAITSLVHPDYDTVCHYYFDVTNSAGDADFVATATLVWNRQQGQTNINNLDLFLYNCAGGNLVTCSTSLVDNVEHVYVPDLPPGRYDLQVFKAGGTNIVSATEDYALAWAFVSPALSLSASGANVVLTWPVYPEGYVVQTTTNLALPVWTTNGLPPRVITNSMNSLRLNATNASGFFRLR